MREGKRRAMDRLVLEALGEKMEKTKLRSDKGDKTLTFASEGRVLYRGRKCSYCGKLIWGESSKSFVEANLDLYFKMERHKKEAHRKTVERARKKGPVASSREV